MKDVKQLCGNDTTLTTIVNINPYVPFPFWSNLFGSPDPTCPFETINAQKSYIDLSEEGSGIYTLKLMTTEKVIIRKIIIE